MLTPIKAIRAKCMDCSNNQRKEIRECPIKNCPLYPFRMGKRPATINSNAEKHEIAKGFKVEGVKDD